MSFASWHSYVPGRLRLSAQLRVLSNSQHTARNAAVHRPFPLHSRLLAGRTLLQTLQHTAVASFLGLPNPELVPASFDCTTTNQGFQGGALHLHCSSSLSVGSKLPFHPRAVTTSLHHPFRAMVRAWLKSVLCAALHNCWKKIAVLKPSSRLPTFHACVFVFPHNLLCCRVVRFLCPALTAAVTMCAQRTQPAWHSQRSAVFPKRTSH